MSKKRFVLTVLTSCADPEREEEFNRWYIHVHLPDLKKTAGLVRARRFTNLDPSDEPSMSLTVYEFETDDMGASIAELSTTAFEAIGKGRHFDVDKFVLKGFYQWEEMNPTDFEPMPNPNYPKG